MTIPYQDLSHELHPLTRTLPITLLNLDPITKVFTSFFSKLKDGETHEHSGLDSALLLVQALYETCLGEAIPYLPTTVRDLVRVGALRALEPKLVERTYSTLSLALRSIAPSLLKTDNIATLRDAWAAVRPYLGTAHKAYVRKCIADAWAGVLRKARGDALQRLMSVLLEEPTPGIEAVWANSMRGANHHLHSRALPIFTVLLDEMAANTTEAQVVTLRHVTIALVHHCTSSAAGETAPLIEAVVARVDLVDPKAATSSKTKAATNFTTSTAFLDILGTFLFTRKGKRFPKEQIKPAILKLQALVAHVKDVAADNTDLAEEQRAERNRWRKALVSGIVGALNAGKLAEWLSPGVGLIDTLWVALPTNELSAFVNMCVAFKWGGVEQFLLAHIARTALSGLEKDPLSTLIVLNNLAGAGFLAGGLSNVQGGKWRQALVKALAQVLLSLEESSLDTNDRRVLGQILELLPYLAGESKHFSDQLINILNRFVGEPDKDSQVNWREAGAWNDSHVVGRLLSSILQLSLRGPGAVQDQFKAYLVDTDLLNVLLRHWHWSREVMAQVADFAEHWPEESNLNSADVDLVLPNVMSADSSLRLSSLKVLAVASANADATAIWNQCKQIELSEMSFQNARERTTQVARLGRQLDSLSNKEEVASTIKSAITYLIAQLKVNFRPVWAEIVTALTALAKGHTETIWTVVWEELQRTIVSEEVIMPDLDVTYPQWTKQTAAQEAEVDDGGEGAEFRCHGLVRARNNVLRAWQESNDATNLDVAEITVSLWILR